MPRSQHSVQHSGILNTTKPQAAHRRRPHRWWRWRPASPGRHQCSRTCPSARWPVAGEGCRVRVGCRHADVLYGVDQNDMQLQHLESGGVDMCTSSMHVSGREALQLQVYGNAACAKPAIIPSTTVALHKSMLKHPSPPLCRHGAAEHSRGNMHDATALGF